MSYTIPNKATATHAVQARPDATDIDVLVAGHARTGVTSGCAVTAQATPNMTVAVASGEVMVAGTRATVTGTNLTIGANSSPDPRKDLVVASSAGALSVVAGTANPNPLQPAVPANSVALAQVLVPAGATAITATEITSRRIVIGALADADIPAAIARDGEVTTAVSNHEAAGDPHAGYRLESVAITDADVAAANKDGATGTASLRTLGTGAQQAAAGNDARLSDARTPTAHASTHTRGSADALALDSTVQLTTAVTNSTVNGSYPDNIAYWRAVTTADSWPVDGFLYGFRTGNFHTQQLQDRGNGDVRSRIWIQGLGWQAWFPTPTALTYDAKGDLVVGTGTDAYARLAVGANNQVLTADSAETTGLKWATATTTTTANDALWDAKGDLAVATGPDAATRLAVGTRNDQLLLVDSATATGLRYGQALTSGPTAPASPVTGDLWVDTSTSLPEVTLRRKTADQSVSSTSLADDTHLTFSIVANAEYIIEASLYVIAAATTTGAAVGLNGPASPTHLTYTAHGQLTQGTGGAASTFFAGGATTYNTILLGNGVPSTTVPALVTINGYLVNGVNGGTFVVRIAAEVAASITYRRGSWARLTRVA